MVHHSLNKIKLT